MIDTVGRGIKKIYTEQRKRFFPMPDYDIDNEHRTVGVTIHGKMIDEKYTNLLKSNQSLSLKECLWLDAVQKHHPITKDAAKHLLDKGLMKIICRFCTIRGLTMTIPKAPKPVCGASIIRTGKN
jgi:ATP-dependent DNA helicase RecG